MADYKALVEKAREIKLSAFGRALVDDLADAVEALVAERNALRAQLEEKDRDYRTAHDAQVERIRELRAQLDGMTTETRRPGLGTGLPRVQQRLVGPWVEVTD